MFKPQINKKSMQIKREGKIEDILYSEAEKKKLNQTRNGASDVTVQASSSKNSQKLILQRFLQDFEAVVSQLELAEDAVIDYEKTEAVCRDLGFYDDK